MQRNSDGSIYCEADLPNGESLSLIQPKDTLYIVDSWDKEGNNRWSKQFSEYPKALEEYNKWVPENKKEVML